MEKKETSVTRIVLNPRTIKALTLKVQSGLKAGDDGTGGGHPTIPTAPKKQPIGTVG